MNLKKSLVLLLVLTLGGVVLWLEPGQYLNLEYFQSRRAIIEGFVADNFLASLAAYFLLYVVVTALSLPAAAVLTVIAGALFGLLPGLLMVSFASSVGATLAFLVARTLLQDWVQRRFGKALSTINRGVERDGAFYLFSLRLVPLFPFFLINLAMGLTRMKAGTFYWVSQVGMLAGTALYVNVGAQLGQATSLPDVFSASVLLSFVGIAVFPWVARAVVSYWRAKRRLRGWSRPAHYEANLVVIGAGSAGLVTSLIGTLVKAKVVLVEKHRMGGDCLNTGCVPSKTLIRSAGVSHLMRRAADFGLEPVEPRVDFGAVMARVRQVIARIEPHDSVERYESMGVECVQGEAEIITPWCVRVGDRDITTRHIVLATGARPRVPPIPGLEQVDYRTSDTIWGLERQPDSLLVMGGGPIGCELAQAFARLGTRVTLVQRAVRLLPGEDEAVSTLLQSQFEKEGIRVLCEHEVSRFEASSDGTAAVLEGPSGESRIAVDVLLLAVGRQPNTEGLGLEKLGIRPDQDNPLELDEYLQTRIPSIHACGDLAGPWRFTHMAAFQAWYAAVNSLFGHLRRYRVNYRVVPRATFTDPEVARVGLNEAEASAQGIDHEVTRYGLDDLDRAIVEGEDRGFITVLTPPGSDRILGVTIVGSHAGELINEFVFAMTHGLGLKKIMATIHIYPTLAEANRFVASEWRRAHAPAWLYPWLERYHRWRRG